MADDNKLVVQIVLDDGSIVKGFAKVEQQAKKTAEKASSDLSDIDTNFGVDGIVSKLKSLVPISATVATAITGAFAAVGIAFERAFAGEKLIALEKQFNDLAASAGLVGKDLEQSLIQASRGTFDFSDNIQVVNQAIIELGSNASKLPQIMEIAQKAAVVTGDTTEQSFTKIINAIESGNVKALRQAGIFVDANKALRDYAITLGLTAGELNQAQKQQAIMNATLEVAEKKFKDVDAAARPMQGAMDRIKVAFNEIADSASKAASGAFGNFFAINMERIAAAAGNATSKTILLESEIKRLEETIANKTTDQTSIPFLEKALAQYRNELKVLQDQASAASKAVQSDGLATKDQAAIAALENSKKLDAQQIEAVRSRETQIQQLMLETRQAQIDADLARANAIPQVSAREAELDLINNQQKQLAEEQHQLMLKQIRDKYSADKGFTQAQQNAAILAEDEKFKAKQIQNEMKLAQQKKAIEQQKFAVTQTNLAAIAELMNSNSKELFEIGKASAIANSTMSTYAAINKTLETGGAFAVPAAIAIGVMGFANVAKIASTSFGEGGGSFTSAGSTAAGQFQGGGINAGITTPIESPATATAQVEPAKPETKIEVNIAGNILNNRETSLHIVELLNDAFEQHGAVVVGA